jgi:hypothetical protein
MARQTNQECGKSSDVSKIFGAHFQHRLHKPTTSILPLSQCWMVMILPFDSRTCAPRRRKRPSGHPVQCISHYDVLLEISRILMEDDLTFND